MTRFLLLGAALLLGSTVATSAPPPKHDLVSYIDQAQDQFSQQLEVHFTEQATVDSPSVSTLVPAAAAPTRLYQVAEGAKFRTYHSKQLRYRSRWHKIQGRWYKFYHLPGRKRPLPRADNKAESDRIG
ncbi:hypothetical protein [Hymenobacter metallicola]|uniref:Uncharacterized protein n=1 Tax=Hymenobacter metallicola TaxID=2563114 RepID=A0A4Z0PYD1_9BACT|nr:hypothetical protein [Hymenobacter metallicola]TGE22790.1 hypothetical protein E5K02_20715 [Hymenobacter metallicola]